MKFNPHFPSSYEPSFSQLRGLVVHSFERVIGGERIIRLAAEVLDESFTSAVSSRDHEERASLLFATVTVETRWCTIWAGDKYWICRSSVALL